jgi:hypothetical protein
MESLKILVPPFFVAGRMVDTNFFINDKDSHTFASCNSRWPTGAGWTLRDTLQISVTYCNMIHYRQGLGS